MENYPQVVEKIANDYLARVKSKLFLVPSSEQDEFLRELQSHLYEAYQQTSGDDDVARILTVLRNLGEPTDVVADRLPGAMVRSGSKRNLPLYILGGVFIAIFGIPIGFGGVSDVRVGRMIEFDIAGTDRAAVEAEVKTLCDRLLANTVIESYRVELI